MFFLDETNSAQSRTVIAECEAKITIFTQFIRQLELNRTTGRVDGEEPMNANRHQFILLLLLHTSFNET